VASEVLEVDDVGSTLPRRCQDRHAKRVDGHSLVETGYPAATHHWRNATMIRNDFTNETAHVANWFLYSGFVDPVSLYTQASIIAGEYAKKDGRR